MVFEQEQTNTINVKYSKLDNVVAFFKNIVSYKMFIFLLILLISCRVEMFGYYVVPYIMLGIATVFKIPLLLPTVVSILLLSIFKVESPVFMHYFITNIVYIMVAVIINIQEVSRKVAIGLKLAISMAIVSILMFMFKGFEFGYLLDNIALIFLVQAIYYIYVYGFYFLSNIDRTMIYSVEEIVSMAVMIMISLLKVAEIANIGMYIWTTIAILFTILIGYTGGLISGIIVSVVIGFLGAIITGEINVLLIISVPGIIASVLNRVNKSFAIIGVIVGSVILNYLTERNLVISPAIIETMVASLIIFLLPKKVTVVFEDIFNKNSTLKSAYEKELGVGSDIKNKLSAMSEVFDNLSSITLNSTKEYFEETQKVIEKYLFDYKEEKCLGCNKRYYCLKENLNLVSSYIARKLEDNDEITENMLPVDCDESAIMIKEIKDIYNNMKLMRIIRQKEEESNTKLAMEYKEIAKLIKNMSRDITQIQKDVPYTQKCIRQELKLLGYQIYEDNYVSENNNIVYEFITDILNDIDTSKNEIQTIIGEVVGQKMNIKLILNSSKNERSRIKLVSEGKYSINSEIYQKSKIEDGECGDTYYVADIKNGKIVALSDGMGSGREAKKSSNIVISTLEKLLIGGFNNNTITKIINGILKLKEESNVSATLDMTIIDAVNEKIQILKLGAAPTYIISNEGVKVIEKDNLPLGVSNNTNEEEYTVELTGPNIIINISDGAYSEILKEYLDYISKKNFDLVKEEEIITGILERIDEKNDDITIIVTKVQ